MYLKRLELLGFKSFASKTTLEFPTGVTAVVGPNGSGKSNVTDALRWVLGETSAKSIRADKAENLMFSGTQGRPRAGFAQVTMTLDNSTGFFPIDYSEVSIRRRVGRDGSSSYFLNDGEVRLRDIVDFFAKARLGTKGFVIINQGNSDMFIKASAAERRMMLEEVLGLRQYQIKRQDAENKLASTQTNLTEARGRVEELLPHLRMLRRQSGKWAKHDELKAELANLELVYFSRKLAELTAEEAKLEPQTTELAKHLTHISAELKELEKALAHVEARQPKADSNFDDFKKKQAELLERRASISKEVGRMEAEVEFLTNAPKRSVKEDELLSLIAAVRKLINELQGSDDIASIKQHLHRLDSQIQQTLEGDTSEKTSRLQSLQTQKEKLAQELGELEASLKELSSHENSFTESLRSFNAEFRTAYEAVEKKRKEQAEVLQRQSRLRFEQEKISMRRAELEHQAEQYGRKLSEFVNTPAGEPLEEHINIEGRILRLRGELASIGDIDPEVVREAKEMEERYAFLEQQITDLDKASEDLTRLIAELKQKIHDEFARALRRVNEELAEHFKTMFGGGKAKLVLANPQPRHIIEPVEDLSSSGSTGGSMDSRLHGNDNRGSGNDSEENNDTDAKEAGLEIELTIPRKNIRGLDMLSGGERSLVSIAVLFALISVSPPPFIVLDEVDAALDENNTKRFANLIKNFAKKSQFIIVTHNRATMASANVLYGVTMTSDGTSKLLSIKFEEAEALVEKP
ncbi:MAG: hypothetical protein COU11_01960 [Candidatus Harrisonbacteria bacterium CG10_big_fil_rev_8_21_14_0_10_49_15]|uniref:RecF/RecN/SMC N-terminal domain-containing protein n=1 Tax=Candidatus Harrisonbacteria bacterium CG10_big_fil_rev_8_21_14_0_10_49_15 TaxID=1974587 RepID=A0A2H0UL87_9BACT|nr:MAG: hypothetical protein COU11_01960 [Candidatus Harrisonbacteria bacterium CG10_big_fil_rev_8_21_14_0_10_49_15]